MAGTTVFAGGAGTVIVCEYAASDHVEPLCAITRNRRSLPL